ncbi:MAG: PBP1A family penicillin-binding protein [Actinomycetota bacterium]
MKAPFSGISRIAARAAPAVLLVLLASCVSVPHLDDELARTARVDQTTKILARDGTVLAVLHAEIDRELVPLSQVPKAVRKAVLAIEDSRFYEHRGVDFPAVVRAVIRDAASGRVVEGGSTITQQLVKNTLNDRERTLSRKMREAMLARQMEARMTKNEILEQYLNTVYFGRGAYGIQAAAHAYFGCNSSRLTLAQGALLAGMIRAPSRYDPLTDPAAAKARRATVLSRMLHLRMIARPAFDAARAEPLGLHSRPETDRYAAPYFVEHVKDLIFDGAAGLDELGDTRADRVNAVFKGGLRIHTTLVPRLQRAAEHAALSTLTEPSDPHTAFVGINPRDGSIVAMVGGRDFFDARDPYAKFNLATLSRRQPGSAFKPFTLVAALEDGASLTSRYRAGSRISIRLPSGETWNVANYEGGNFAGSMSLKQATALSVNVVYAQVVRDVGADHVVDVARRMGITAPLSAVPSIALGSQEVSPLDLAGAYSTLARGGKQMPPVAITKITDAAGKILYRSQAKPKSAISPAVNALTVEALQEVMRTGTGRRLATGFPVAGKTGTSDEYHDAWFAGFTPTMVGVSWVGFPRAQISMRPPRTRIRVYGSSWPGRMWREFMLEAHRGVPAKAFPRPKDLLVTVGVDRLRGCLPNRFTPRFLVRQRSFLRGEEPTTACDEPTSHTVDAVPDVRGAAPSAARQILWLAGLDVLTRARYCPERPPGVVCAQEPAPGTRARVGDRVTIWVGDDTAVGAVPMVLGDSSARARTSLQRAGFSVEFVTAPNAERPNGCRDPVVTGSGRAWAQSPCAEAPYGRGSVVTVWVNP